MDIRFLKEQNIFFSETLQSNLIYFSYKKCFRIFTNTFKDL